DPAHGLSGALAAHIKSPANIRAKSFPLGDGEPVPNLVKSWPAACSGAPEEHQRVQGWTLRSRSPKGRLPCPNKAVLRRPPPITTSFVAGSRNEAAAPRWSNGPDRRTIQGSCASTIRDTPA